MKAFPRQPIYYAETKTVDKQDGMDLRDYFAAKVMVALIDAAFKAVAENEDINEKDVCLYCYEWADAMMEARK